MQIKIFLKKINNHTDNMIKKDHKQEYLLGELFFFSQLSDG